MQNLPRFTARFCLLLVLVYAGFLLCVPAGTATAQGPLAVSPSEVSFANTAVGSVCPGANCSYAMVTITNNGTRTERLVGAKADPTPPFWPTFGGTCNVKFLYLLPPKASCTFQWGFKPEEPGKAKGTGSISFESGASVNVGLTGTGTGRGRGRGRG